MTKSIAVIVVLYQSTLPELYYSLLKNLAVSLIVIDNTPQRNLNLKAKNLHYIPLFSNKGIACAQNVGIAKVKELGSNFILFLDQDSYITSSYIDNIYNEYLRISSEIYPQIAFLGPILINKSNEQYYKMEKSIETNQCRIVSKLISSGSLIRTSILDKIGMMDESLFIDYVDFDICWRAIQKGYINCISTNISLIHQVGYRELSILNQPIIISAPIRYFYQYRNFLLLLRRNYVPMCWKIKTMIRKICEFFFLLVCCSERKFIFKNIIRGIKQGILN